MSAQLLKDISDLAKKNFADAPFPNSKDEFWRFSKYAEWGVDALFPYFASHTKFVPNADFTALENATIQEPCALLMCDGQILAAKESNGIEIISLVDAAQKYPENLAKLYSDDSRKFDLLVSSRAGNGAYVKVADGVHASIEIFTSSKLSLSVSSLAIEVGKGASLEILRHNAVYGGSFCASRFALFASEGAKVELAELALEGNTARKFARADFYLSKNAELVDAFAELGKASSRDERNYHLRETGARVDARAFASARGEIVKDIRSNQLHTAEGCSSNFALKSALNDNSKLAFSGLIRVDEIAQQTDAYLSSRSLLLSNNAQANASPILEICANDVSCSHGCTVSKPDEDSLFYMRQRGLSLEEAKRLIIEGFAETTFERISNEKSRQAIRNLNADF